MTLKERLKKLLEPGGRKARRAARIVFDPAVVEESKDLLSLCVKAIRDEEIDEEEARAVVEALEEVATAVKAARRKGVS